MNFESSVQVFLANPTDGDPRQDGEFTLDEVTAAISKLKRYKAAGQDNIPPELLKSAGPYMCTFLTALFNTVWRAECIPSTWRKGVIVSTYKAGDRTDCANYRPITLLPTIDKLFTAILANRLLSTVALHDHQFAFRPGRGTMDPIFVLSSLLQHRKARNQRTHVFFLDIKKPTTLFGTRASSTSSTVKASEVNCGESSITCTQNVPAQPA
jgi:Reverse transcriptase (RNA-dependent DNA polymerase)